MAITPNLTAEPVTRFTCQPLYQTSVVSSPEAEATSARGTTFLITALKALLPQPLKARIRSAHRNRTLVTALRHAEFQLKGDEPLSDKLIEQLVYGWSNEGWSAKPNLLSCIANQYRNPKGGILECGTGLSTVLLSMIARRSGSTLRSLEHHSAWHELISQRFRSLGLDRTELLLTPLRHFDSFDWYDTTTRLPIHQTFSLVLCDGPPNTTFGGRYGLLPLMFDRLNPGAEILMDDTHKPEAADVVRRWLDEYRGRLEVSATFSTYSILVVK